MLKLSVKKAKTFAVIWLVIISVLFFLPGSALPKEKLFEEIFFDKWVHFALFAPLLFGWRFYFPDDVWYSWGILLLALCYGFGVEVIQHYFIPNRSFDLGDVTADVLGAAAGVWAWHRHKKNRPL